MRGLEGIFPLRRLANLIGLKAIYQALYIVFNIIIIKKLSVDEYGVYAYIVALIVYFSTIPLLGLPLYLQKDVSRHGELNKKYLIISSLIAFFSLFVALLIMPNITLFQKLSVLMIIVGNFLLVIPVSINDGLGRYTFQYKFLFFTSIWMMACLIQVFYYQENLNLSSVLNYWFLNSLAGATAALIIIFYLFQNSVKLISFSEKTYLFLLLDLALLYSVSIPETFVKFYDRYLAQRFFNNLFLGNYAFNSMLVMTVHALFIRPVNSVLFTKLTKMRSFCFDTVITIKKYYLFGLSIYFVFFLFYFALSEKILVILGLEKYLGTLTFFCVCMINAVLNFISIPFITLIAISDESKKKILYCILSLTIFNLPIIFCLWGNSGNYFLLGFCFSYFLNFLLSILLQYDLAYALLFSIFSHDTALVKFSSEKLNN